MCWVNGKESRRQYQAGHPSKKEAVHGKLFPSYHAYEYGSTNDYVDCPVRNNHVGSRLKVEPVKYVWVTSPICEIQ